MCEFCVQHGEGKKWYLQAKNYSEELWNEERKHFMSDYFEKWEENMVNSVSEIDKLLAADPATAKAAFPSLSGAAEERALWAGRTSRGRGGDSRYGPQRGETSMRLSQYTTGQV